MLDGVPKSGLPKDHDAAGEATVRLATVLQRAGRSNETSALAAEGLKIFASLHPELLRRLDLIAASRQAR